MLSSDIDLEYLSQVLGENNFRRLLSFCEYKSGWDGQASRPISESSVRFMQLYFNTHYGKDYKAPVYFLDNQSERDRALCLFMTSEGYMTLNWLEPKTKAVKELTFFEDGKTIIYSENACEYSIDLALAPKYPPLTHSTTDTSLHLNFTHKFSKTDYVHWVNYWNKQNAK